MNYAKENPQIFCLPPSPPSLPPTSRALFTISIAANVDQFGSHTSWALFIPTQNGEKTEYKQRKINGFSSRENVSRAPMQLGDFLQESEIHSAYAKRFLEFPKHISGI
jgi:hypothetical protein